LRYGSVVAHLLGYARVSTGEQKLDLQVDELTAAGCWKVWTDQASGALDRRPQLDAVLAALRRGDTLVVWRLDRLGRSLRHLIETVTLLDERGVGFRSLRESIDTTTAGGRLVFHLFGALAQFEREIIRDRTMAGLASARARGRVGGRPSKLSDEQRRQARRMYDSRELTVEQIGRVLGVSRTSIYRALGAAAGSALREMKAEDGARLAPAAGESQGAVVLWAGQSRVDGQPEVGGEIPAVASPPGPVPSTGQRRRAGVGTGADWFVVAVGEGERPDAPVVVLSRHRSQQAARTAWVKASRDRPPGAPVGEVIEVRAASTIAASIEWDQDARRPVVRPGPPARDPAAL